MGEKYYVNDIEKMALRNKENKNGKYLPPTGGPGYGDAQIPQGVYGMPNQSYSGPQDRKIYQNMGGNGMAWAPAPQKHMQG